MTVFQWRVTKYDPRRRDRQGRFRDDDWTAVSDIGAVFGGRPLDVDDYLAVEDRYVAAAMRFRQDSRADNVRVVDLEPPDLSEIAEGVPLTDLVRTGPPITEGQRVIGVEFDRLVRLNLRSLIWCKLEQPGRFFVHFGHDYYMYIGSAEPCAEAIAFAEQSGLFVEPMTSPYGATAD